MYEANEPELAVGYRTRVIVLLHLIFWLIAACTSEPTPFPVDIPPTVSSAADLSVIRYALAPNTEGLISDLPLLETKAQIEQLTEPVNPADLGTRYDLVAAYGELPGGTPSPMIVRVALITNMADMRLDNATFTQLLRQSLQPSMIVSELAIPSGEAITAENPAPAHIRAELANAGWPDGITLSAAYADAPGAIQVGEQLASAGIRSSFVQMSRTDLLNQLETGLIQIGLLPWRTDNERTEWVNRFGETNIIDLYSLPINYLASPDLTITFSEGGWPIPSR